MFWQELCPFRTTWKTTTLEYNADKNEDVFREEGETRDL